MKFSLIAALVVVLALAQGSRAEVPDIEKITQYFEDMKTKLTQELTSTFENHDLAGQAQTLRTQVEPVVSQIQEQLKSVAANVEEQLKPLATNVQSQVQPLFENFQKQIEAMLQNVMAQQRPIGQ